jgi:hypothetical protein
MIFCLVETAMTRLAVLRSGGSDPSSRKIERR